jgi:hypothetical protein
MIAVRMGIRLGPFWISSGGGRSRRRVTTYTASLGDWHCHHAHRTAEAATECAARNGPRRSALSPAYEAELQMEGRRILQKRQAREAQAAEADLRRLRNELDPAGTAVLDERPAWMVDGMQATLLEGNENLAIVGESHYQDNLWRLAGREADRSAPVRIEVTAILVAEPNNPYDTNAVAVWINGLPPGAPVGRALHAVEKLSQGTTTATTATAWPRLILDKSTSVDP